MKVKMYDMAERDSLPAPSVQGSKKHEPYYPTLYIKGIEDFASLAVGKDQTGHIEFEVVRQSKSEENGKKTVSTEIKVKRLGLPDGSMGKKPAGILCTRCAHKTPGAYCSNCGSKKGD